MLYAGVGRIYRTVITYHKDVGMKMGEDRVDLGPC